MVGPSHLIPSSLHSANGRKDIDIYVCITCSLCSAITPSHMYTSTVGAHVTSCLTVLFVECAHGFLPSATINLYGPPSKNVELSFTARNRLFVFPSMNFSCDGTITSIRMRLGFVTGFEIGTGLEEVVYFLLFHDGLNSPTRRVTHILLNQTNTQQELPNEIWTNSDPLSLPVTEGSFIGLAVPDNRSLTMHTKGINVLPKITVICYYTYQLAAFFSEFEGRVLEAARTADSSQFTTLLIGLPLIDVSVSK